MINEAVATKMRSAFDDIEEAYEFMLAYAAQGRRSEGPGGAGPSQIRQFLQQFGRAADALSESLAGMSEGDAASGFRKRWLDDIAAVRSIVDMLLAQPSITSEMVDNTNGLIALRSFLTDIFFADHVMLPKR